MNLKSSNFKIYLGAIYLIILFTANFFFWSNFDLADLTSYELIRENRDQFNVVGMTCDKNVEKLRILSNEFDSKNIFSNRFYNRITSNNYWCNNWNNVFILY